MLRCAVGHFVVGRQLTLLVEIVIRVGRVGSVGRVGRERQSGEQESIEPSEAWQGIRV